MTYFALSGSKLLTGEKASLAFNNSPKMNTWTVNINTTNTIKHCYSVGRFIRTSILLTFHAIMIQVLSRLRRAVPDISGSFRINETHAGGRFQMTDRSFEIGCACSEFGTLSKRRGFSARKLIRVIDINPGGAKGDPPAL